MIELGKNWSIQFANNLEILVGYIYKLITLGERNQTAEFKIYTQTQIVNDKEAIKKLKKRALEAYHKTKWRKKVITEVS